MSLFLGPIHHKLFYKICFLRDMDLYIAEELNEDYTSSIPNEPLEMLVGENIHGSLQEMIAHVESEHAAFMTKLYNKNYEDWKASVIKYAREHVIFKDFDTIEATFNEHFLHGMPCDRIVLSEANENIVIITLQADEHAKYYEDIKVLQEERELTLSNMVWSNINVECNGNQFIFTRRND